MFEKNKQIRYKDLIDYVVNYLLTYCKNLHPFPQSVRFNYTGNFQEYIVPNNTTVLQIDCVGGAGGTFGSKTGGKGGRVICDLNVNPGQKLYIWVACKGNGDPHVNHLPVKNSSDIRLDKNNSNTRLVVAGGGGTSARNTAGGDGGNLIGQTAQSIGWNGGRRSAQGGGGGSQDAGGYGGKANGHKNWEYFGTAGSESGDGGIGGYYGYATYGFGGAGGAGYYGGGGGGCANGKGSILRAGGGGGSSYTNPALCKNVSHFQGYNDAEGYIIIQPKVINDGLHASQKNGYSYLIATNPSTRKRLIGKVNEPKYAVGLNENDVRNAFITFLKERKVFDTNELGQEKFLNKIVQTKDLLNLYNQIILFFGIHLKTINSPYSVANQVIYYNSEESFPVPAHSNIAENVSDITSDNVKKLIESMMMSIYSNSNNTISIDCEQVYER